MQNSLELYTDIGNELNKKNKGIFWSPMFGMPTLKADGKAFSGLFNNDMVFKLPGSHHAAALALDGAKLFDPGMGRPMKEWVQIPLKISEQWKKFAEAAMNYVISVMKAKEKKYGSKNPDPRFI
jgi:hypothetical protein